MQPAAVYETMVHVETEYGTEILPLSIVTDGLLADCLQGTLDPEAPYEQHSGWYGRLTMPGYLDCTEWRGPFETATLAIGAVNERFPPLDDA